MKFEDYGARFFLIFAVIFVSREFLLPIIAHSFKRDRRSRIPSLSMLAAVLERGDGPDGSVRRRPHPNR